MSESNRTAVGIVEEALATPGTTPATPAFENLRFKSSTFAYSAKSTTSNEIRADRQVPDLIRVGFEAGGDLPLEVSQGSVDTLIRGLLMSEWLFMPVRDNKSGTIITAVSATAYTVNAAAGGASQVSQGAFVLGQLVRGTGFTNAGNNRIVRAAAGTSGTSIVITAGVVEGAPPATARLKTVGFQGASGDITATATGLASTALDFTTLGLRVGQWIKVGGTAAGERYATAANNDWCRIQGPITATVLPLDNRPTGWAVDAGAAKTISCYVGDLLRNGTTERSYTIELQYQDITVPEYEYYRGMVVGALELDAAAQAILEGTFTFMGMTAQNTTTRFAGSTDVAAPTNSVMNTSSSVGRVSVGGAAVIGPNFVMGLKLNVNNTLRRQNALGQLGSIGIGLGRVQVTGSMDLYYGNNAILTQIRNNTATSYSVLFSDPNGNAGYYLDIPQLKFSNGNPTIPGVDTDRMISAPFQGVIHPTLLYTIQIQRQEYYEV